MEVVKPCNEWTEEEWEEDVRRRREEYKLRRKQYLKERAETKVECDNCKSVVCLGSLTRHKKSKKCMDYNKEKILENKREKVECDNCGAESTKHHLARHKKTKKCMEYKK